VTGKRAFVSLAARERATCRQLNICCTSGETDGAADALRILAALAGALPAAASG